MSNPGKSLLVVTSTSPGQVTKQRSQPEMTRSYSGTAPPPIKKQPSQPSVLSHTQEMALIPMQLVKKDHHLRPIQPKPIDKDNLPLIHFTVSDDDGGNYTTRLPRAISEEPLLCRPGAQDLLSPGPGPSQLTQSVSQDTGLEGGVAVMSRYAGGNSATLNVPKISGGSTSASSVAHSPVLREGPALGCNYCWNSQDNQGRVQRRKTKYHCPACRTNLCIVPCFHEYHSQIQKQQDQHKQFAKVLTKTSST